MVTDWPWLSYERSGGIALFMNALATTHKSVKLLHIRAREPYFLSRKLSSSLKNTALRLARRQCPEGIVEGHKSRSRSCCFFPALGPFFAQWCRNCANSRPFPGCISYRILLRTDTTQKDPERVRILRPFSLHRWQGHPWPSIARAWRLRGVQSQRVEEYRP